MVADVISRGMSSSTLVENPRVAIERVARPTMMYVRFLILGVLLASTPLRLQGQSAEQRIEAARSRAREAGIPVALLDSKIAEGRAKGIPLERIAAAVENRRETIERAMRAMRLERTAMSDEVLVAGADAIGAGVSDDILGAIVDRAPRERRALAITALTALVAQNVAPDDALARVTEALARGPEALASLPGHAVARAATAGGQAARGNPARPPNSASASGRQPAVDPSTRPSARGPENRPPPGRN